MPAYKYTALTEEGLARNGVHEGDTARDVQAQLRAESLYVTGIEKMAESGDETERRRAPLFMPTRKSAREVALLTRQLATLLAAGVPLVESLDVLVEQSASPRFRMVLMDVREKVTQGTSLASAMRNHSRYFDTLYLAMVDVGQASGELDLALKRMADYIEARNRTQQKVLTALTYPAIMCSVGVAVVLFLIYFVVPNITGILLEQGRDLPLPTAILVSISSAFQSFWWVLAAAVLVGLVTFRIYRATDAGRYATDALLLKTPLIGPLFRKQSVSRFATTFSTLLRSGIPALDCLDILMDVVDNRVLSRTLGEVKKNVMSGTDISTPLKKSGVFPPLVGYMVAVGEESGQLESILDQIAESYEEEVDQATERLTSLIEPILILVLASIVGFIVLSILLPIMEISDI